MTDTLNDNEGTAPTRAQHLAPRTSRPSCHGDGPGETAGPEVPRIALVGAPNVGKSTLFNAITGARRTVGNWPGTTVEVGSGVWPAATDATRGRSLVAAQVNDTDPRCHPDACPSDVDQLMTVLDLPGAYSLDPLSPDEELTRDLLVGPRRPDVVVATVDAAHLARSLYLVAQLVERAVPTVVALTMLDVARRHGLSVDAAALAEAIGCPVIVVDPRRRTGTAALAVQVRRVVRECRSRPGGTEPLGSGSDSVQLTASDSACDAAESGDDLELADARFEWIERAVAASARRERPEGETWSDRLDRVVTAPVLGPLIFLATMWLVFQLTTSVAAPLQGALDGLFSGPLSEGARALFATAGLGGSILEGFVVAGLIAGVGMLLTFVPLMALMFLLLALLEDSGYMARAAVVTDRLMRRIGLPGQAFLPLVVGFGCNVPAISATRILGQARQRLLVALLVPFTSCSARLTVYVLLASIFFPDHAGSVVFAMYLLSIVLVVLVGLLLRATLWRTMGADPLVLHLPPYQRPTVRLTLSVMWTRLSGFLRTAGGIIVCTVAIVWLLQQVPMRGVGTFGAVATQDSAYGVFAQAIAPLFAPAGFAQWQSVSALIVGFVAKEAVISSWAQTYAVADPTSGMDGAALAEHIQAAFAASSGGHPLAAVLAFMVFLLAYTPCVATLAAQKREIGWRWTAFGIAMQLTTAYVLAVLVFQIGRLVGA